MNGTRLRWLLLALLAAVPIGAAGLAGIRALQRGRLHLSAAARASLGPAAPCAALARSARLDCVRNALTEQVRREGTRAAMATLKAFAAVDQDVEREGHVYAHGLGIEGYLARRSVSGAFDGCPIDFSSGCGHGVIQAYLESRTVVDSGTVNGLCAPYLGKPETIWALFQCVHGMGHGLDMMYGGELPNALGACDLLGQQTFRDACYGGAFMENIMEETSPHHPASELTAMHDHMHPTTFKRLDPTDLLYPCSKVAVKYLRPCYEIQTAAILYFTKWDIATASAVCDSAPGDFRGTCYKSLGRDITSSALRDPGKTRGMCDRTGERYRPWCYFGAVKSLVDWDANPGAGLAFCELLGETPGWVFCYRGVGEEIIALGKPNAERETLCGAALKPEGVEACRYGAALPGSKLSSAAAGVQ